MYTWGSATKNVFKTFSNREKKSLRHAAMVATFLDLNKNRPGPANIAEKTKKMEKNDFPVPDCTQEQNCSPQFSSMVRQCKWPSMSRTIVEIQKFCYHGNLTSRFSLFLWVSLSFMMWRSFFADRQEAVGMRDNPSLCTLARQIF